jgi:hypothetical protein
MKNPSALARLGWLGTVTRVSPIFVPEKKLEKEQGCLYNRANIYGRCGWGTCSDANSTGTADAYIWCSRKLNAYV